MNIVGKWGVKEIQAIIPYKDGTGFDMDWVAVGDLESKGISEEYAMIASSNMEFLEDGSVVTTAELPADELESAKAAGAELVDGKVVVDKRKDGWKEADGKFLINNGEHGEVLGEPIDPYKEVIELPDGIIQWEMIRLYRID